MSSSFENQNTSRTVRVFISSTFRDMQAERDYLVKHIFPELRARCKARQVEFVEVDLRWGITEKQTESGETLPRCLEIINTCRPYFIGILGERYGWVPPRDAIPKRLLKAQPWLGEHLDASVTELEILHGVLNNPAMAGRAFFYFRDPAFQHRISPAKRADYVDEDPILREKLERLKRRIRENSHNFPVREGYPDPKALGKLVLDDLWQAIDRQFPPISVHDDLERLAAEHLAFAARRAMLYTPLGDWQERLDDHEAKPSPPLVITGESGIGKSSLLANWTMNYRKEHPDCLVLDHFIGVSRDSACPETILRRFMGEMKCSCTITAAIPEKPEELVAAFPGVLSEVSLHGKVILVIDALNQLDEGESPFSISWLPTSFPDNVHVILSTTQGLHLEQARNRGWRIAVIKPPSPVEIRGMIDSYLQHYLKNMEPQQIDRIVAAPQAHNPLYLRVLLDELRTP